MKVILVWYWITAGIGNAVHFSPPFATQEDCQKVRAEFGYQRGVCMQIKELVK